tara:strand:+ start:3431 stop:3646 length:216 start_codon:yes stop_codon:yes gene_type:complete
MKVATHFCKAINKNVSIREFTRKKINTFSGKSKQECDVLVVETNHIITVNTDTLEPLQSHLNDLRLNGWNV